MPHGIASLLWAIDEPSHAQGHGPEDSLALKEREVEPQCEGKLHVRATYVIRLPECIIEEDEATLFLTGLGTLFFELQALNHAKTT